MKLTLYYGDLSRTASNASKLANELDEYCDNLTKKVQHKLYSIEGGMSSALNTADYYVNQKLQNLKARSTNARSFARQVEGLLETARRVEADVKSTIESNQDQLFRDHAELRPSNVELFLTSFLCDAKKVPILGSLLRGGEAVYGAVTQLKDEIRFWYKCEGGKELVGVVLSTAACVLATVVFVAAFAASGGTVLAIIAAVAGVVSAAIGLVNAVTNIVTSAWAYDAAVSGHPGQARIYARQDTLATVLRETNFHDKSMNRGSNAAATGIEITEAVCGVITIVGGAAQTIEKVKKINVEKTLNALCKPRDVLGRFMSGEESIWNGVKCIVSKADGKDFILGDLNVKNLSRLSKMKDPLEKIKTIGKLAKAANGVVTDLDKINEGDMSFGEFVVKRVLTGANKALFQQETLETKTKADGTKERKYEYTKFATIIKVARIPLEDTGIKKLLIGLEPSGTLDNVVAPSSGVIGKVKNIISSLGKLNSSTKYTVPTVSEIPFNTNDGVAESTPTARVPNVQPPVLRLDLASSRPSYTLPNLQPRISLQYRYPYIDLTA